MKFDLKFWKNCTVIVAFIGIMWDIYTYVVSKMDVAIFLVFFALMLAVIASIEADYADYQLRQPVKSKP